MKRKKFAEELRGIQSEFTGRVTELEIATLFTQQNLWVSFPYGQNPDYDLIVQTRSGGKLRSVQCKAGRLRNGVLAFNATDNRNRTYVGRADFIAAMEVSSGDVFLIKPEELGQLGSLRYALPKNNQQKGIRFAAGFKFADVVEQWKREDAQPGMDSFMDLLTDRVGV